MRFKWMLLIVLILTMAPKIVSGEQISSKQISNLEKLDGISDEALQMGKFHRYDDAKKLLDYFSSQFSSMKSNAKALTMDQLQIVTTSRDQAVDAMVSPTMDDQEKINRLTMFRLVIDAISSSRQPLWTAMKDQVMTAVHQTKEAAAKGDAGSFHSKFNTFLNLYNIIYPSIKIDAPIEEVQKLDARINYIDEYRTQVVFNPKGKQELDGLEADLNTLFDSNNQDQADPSIWWVIISTGSIIIMTLSYVGWRKYLGEKNLQKDRSRDLKD